MTLSQEAAHYAEVNRSKMLLSSVLTLALSASLLGQVSPATASQGAAETITNDDAPTPQPRAQEGRVLTGTLTEVAEALPVVAPIYAGYRGTQSFIPKAVANKKDKRGCNLRQRMLIEAATKKPKVGKKCRMRGGVWMVDGGATRVTKPKNVVLMPAVSYKQAWGQGASQWTPEQRLEWATQVTPPNSKLRTKFISTLGATQLPVSKGTAKLIDDAGSELSRAQRDLETFKEDCQRGFASLFAFLAGSLPSICFDGNREFAEEQKVDSEKRLGELCAAAQANITNTAAWGLSISPSEAKLLTFQTRDCRYSNVNVRISDMAVRAGITPIPNPQAVPGAAPAGAGFAPFDPNNPAALDTFDSYVSSGGVTASRQLFGAAAPVDWVRPGVPLGYLRLWDAGVSWRQIETSKGNYNWNTMDATIRRAQEIGASVMYVLGDTPAWANGGNAGNVPPTNLSDATDFVAALCSRYGGQITSYEVWNEGNLTTFWTGTMDQLADLTRDVNATVKGCAPSSQVYASSTGTRASNAFVTKFPEYLRALSARGWPVDGYTVHSYPAASGGPAERIQEIAQFKTLLAQSGAPVRPILDTELNYGLAGLGQGRRVIDEQTGAAYISQSFIQSMQYGIASLFWFLWTETDYDKLGIQLNPASALTRIAWNTTFNWLAGSTMTRCTQNGQLHACQIRTSDGRNLTLLWTDRDTVVARTEGLGRLVMSVDGVVSRNMGGLEVGIAPVAVGDSFAGQ